MRIPSSDGQGRQGKAVGEGFSLFELLVAMAVFLIISSAAFTLFGRHQAVLSEEQLTVGLNIGLRNALAQIQIDVVNAGNGLLMGTNVPAWPVGVTIINSTPTSATCNPSGTVYTNACFDQLNVILVDSTMPALHPCGINPCSVVTSSGGTITLNAPPPSGLINAATGLPWTATDLKKKFSAGDQILFIQSCSGGGHANGTNGCAFTTAILEANASTSTNAAIGCAAGCVSLSFNSTTTPAAPPPVTTPPTPPSQPYPGSNSVCPTPTPVPNTCNDPLNMTTRAPYTDLTDTYGSNDWVVRLAPITYNVNANNVDSNNQPDPQLVRTQGNVQNVLMDQVIGFKVGAALWNNANTTFFQYNYDASTYTTPYEYDLIRSVRVSIIGRTEPNGTNPYVNGYDYGHYMIRGNSIIVDPRNLTMNGD